jgi:hypothetical protein
MCGVTPATAVAAATASALVPAQGSGQKEVK